MLLFFTLDVQREVNSYKKAQEYNMAKWANIQQEAKDFKKRKVTAKSLKPLTSRRYMAGQALTGLLARSSGYVNREVLRREAYEWADFMLDDDY